MIIESAYLFSGNCRMTGGTILQPEKTGESHRRYHPKTLRLGLGDCCNVRGCRRLRRCFVCRDLCPWENALGKVFTEHFARIEVIGFILPDQFFVTDILLSFSLQ
jgi:hypothetical protein